MLWFSVFRIEEGGIIGSLLNTDLDLKVKISFWKIGFSWQVLILTLWNLNFCKINHTFCLWSQDLWVLFMCKNLNLDYVSQTKWKTRVLFCLLAFLEGFNQVWMEQWNACWCWVTFSNQWKLQTRLAVSQPSLGFSLLMCPEVQKTLPKMFCKAIYFFYRLQLSFKIH